MNIKLPIQTRPPEEQTSAVGGKRRKIVVGILLILPAVLLFLGLFYEPVFFNRQFCYRDSGFFYYPLFRQLQTELNAGRLPTWDPCDNLGMPLAGNPTSALFYPPKLIFFLTIPFPSLFGFCYKWYILLHFPVAFYGFYRLARYWGRSVSASLFGAAAYTFCAPVFFQYCNVIFLVGAAWLPWAIWQGSEILRCRNRRAIIWLGLILALMVTGGDPQTAYLTGLALCGLLLFYRPSGTDSSLAPIPASTKTSLKKERRRLLRESDSVAEPRPSGVWRNLAENRLLLLMAAGGIGALLSMAVVLPAREIEKNSDRAVKESPDSIWEVPSFLANGFPPVSSGGGIQLAAADSPEISRVDLALEGLFWPKLRGGGHRWNQYDLSVPPWRLVELLWPNFGGSSFRRSSWMVPLPNERCWIPTFYIGILPLLFAFSVFRLRRTDDSERRWASWMLLGALLASLGGFGLVWFGRAAAALFGQPADLTFTDGDPVGGLYWLMTLLLPKFYSFRFPVKLLTFFVLASSVLAAYGLDSTENRVRLRRLVFGTILLSAAALILFSAASPIAVMNVRGPNFDAHDTRLLVLAALIQPILALLLFLPLEKFRAPATPRKFPWPETLVTLLLAVDLICAYRGFVPTLRQSEVDQTPAIILRMRAESDTLAADSKDGSADSKDGSGDSKDGSGEAAPPIRFYQYPLEWFPDVEPTLSGSAQVAALSNWQRKILYPKHSIPYRVGVIQMGGTMLPADMYLAGCYLATQYRDETPEKRLIAAILALCDVEFMLAPPDKSLEDAALIAESAARPVAKIEGPPDSPAEWPVDAALWKNQVPRSRVRIFRDGELNNLSSRPSDPIQLYKTALTAPGTPQEGEYAKVTGYRPDRIEMEILLKKPGDAVIAEQFWPGWHAAAVPIGSDAALVLPIERDKQFGMMRRISLPAGHWRVTMFYRPTRLYIGMAVSLLTFLAAAAALIRKRAKE